MANIHLLCVLFTLLTIGLGNCAKILIMVTVPSPSLFNIHTPIIEALYNRKHDLTILTLYPLKKPLPNAKVLQLQPSHFGSDEEVTKNFLFKLAEASPISEVYSFTSMNDWMCMEFLLDKNTQTILEGGKQFDLVVTDGFADCVLAYAAIVGKHIIDILCSGNFPWAYSDVPLPPSYIPNYYRRMPSNMTFWQRMINTIDIAAFRLIYEVLMQPANEKVITKYLPQAPSLEEIYNKIELTLTNADPVMFSPRPSMSNHIDIGGVHCKTAKPLPKDLEDFVESSGEDGFIMFGLGTNMKSKYLPLETRNAILSALSRLKQKVIWKFEAKLDNLPKNVKITHWMPQQDLLGHPKIRLFITHSGLLSLQEAVYHGVPVIGMPFFMDQGGNIGRVQELGMGEYLDFFNLTADGLYDLINKVLTDKRYHDNAKKYSAITRDRPMKPIDKAIFWIEYVLRHDGTKHFRPASRELNFFQYFLLDVVAFLLLVTASAVGIVVLVAKFLLRQFLSKKQSGKLLDKKQR